MRTRSLASPLLPPRFRSRVLKRHCKAAHVRTSASSTAGSNYGCPCSKKNVSYFFFCAIFKQTQHLAQSIPLSTHLLTHVSHINSTESKIAHCKFFTKEPIANISFNKPFHNAAAIYGCQSQLCLVVSNFFLHNSCDRMVMQGRNLTLTVSPECLSYDVLIRG